MNLKCMNAVRNPDKPEEWIRCGWEGTLPTNVGTPCPRCCKVGVMARVIDVPNVGQPSSDRISPR